MYVSNYIRKISTFIVLLLFSTKFWNYHLFMKNRIPNLNKQNQISFSKSKLLKLRVISYNLFLLPDLFFCNVLDHKHSDFKKERSSLICKYLSNFDIVLFQEVHPYFNFRCSNIIEQAKKKGLIYSYCNLGPTFFSKYVLSNGLLILSRYPIVSTDYKTFSKSYSYDSLMEKGVIYTKVQIHHNIPPIHVFNTHLQASYSKKQIWEEVRLCQLKEFNEFIYQKANINKDYVICGGDFNIDYYNNEYHHLKNLLSPLSDTFGCKNIRTPIKHTITIPFDKDDNEMSNICLICKHCKTTHVHKFENQKLDYIFYKEHKYFKHKLSSILPFYIKNKTLPFKQLSDHYAYYSEFEIMNSTL